VQTGRLEVGRDACGRRSGDPTPPRDGVAAFGEGTTLAITQAAQPCLGAGARWALAGGIGTFALSLAMLHLGAEWTSLRDRSCIARICVAVLAFALAATGGAIAPLLFVAILAAAVLAALLVEAFTFRAGATSIWAPPLAGGGVASAGGGLLLREDGPAALICSSYRPGRMT
jgi:hypothetical protein